MRRPEAKDTHIDEAEEIEDSNSRDDVKIDLQSQLGFGLWVECDERSALHDRNKRNATDGVSA